MNGFPFFRFTLALAALLWTIHVLANRHSFLPATISDEPRQTMAADVAPWSDGKYLIAPLARYDIHARVLHRERYYYDREADLSPIDFAVGWGAMSDPAVYPAFHISQGGRWYFWRGSSLLSNDQVIGHSANMHLIPATSTVKLQLLDVRAGDVVRLTGYLIRVTGAGGYEWASSLSRTDTGGHSCELMWVESISREE